MGSDNKSFALVGYGVSARAMHKYLLSKGVTPVIREQRQIFVPSGTRLITDNYLNTDEDIIIRSPSVRPDKIRGNGKILTEAQYALEITRGFKIGVSGSSGKTTSTSLICQILKNDGKDARKCGNIGTPIISLAPSSTEESYTVCELSSFQLMDMTPHLDVALLTNISENHLDWHIDISEYENAKANLIKNASLCVLNYDDVRARPLEKSAREVAFFSLCGLPKDIRHSQVCAYLDGESLICNGQEIINSCELKIKGRFNIANALGAICAVWGLVDIESIRHTLRTFEGVSGRMELVDTISGVRFVCSSIDSTPERTIATLSALDITKCVIIMGGYDKNLSYEPLYEATKDARGVVLLGANADKIARAIKKDAPRAKDLSEAVKIALDLATDGDTVLLSPASASFDMFENYRDREEKFKEIVRGLKWKKSESF